jgi:hypothetical protein
MAKLKTIAIVVLLLTSVAYAKSPTLLLQEGLYAEETEGDLQKAIGLYQQVLQQYKEVERLAARATYQLGMCHLKKGETETAGDYFQEVTDYYPEQTRLVKRAQAQLDKIGVTTKAEGNVFDVLGAEVCPYIGSKYGEVCAEAGMKQLYSNSHIYVVDNDFTLRSGGMGYVYNWTGKPITQRHRLSGTSYPNQKLYSISGDEMDIEIVPDERRSGFYHVYWNPEEPLEPGGFFNYGWATDGADDRLSPTSPAGGYSLTMQNKFGDHCYETFFLAIPQGTVLSYQSEEYTKMKNMDGWDIYWWKKEVPPNTNHVVNVVLGKTSTESMMTQELNNTIDADGLIHFKSPNKISNNNSEPVTTRSFINSDFVSLTKMYEEDGTAIPFETTHEGNIYRYNITFNKPIPPGEDFVYYTEGTISGLIKPVPNNKETFRYFMVHSPAAGQPVLRIETFLLPEGAVFISTSTPNIEKTEKDGRIEIRVEEVVPANGSITTEFQYKLSGGKLASSEPLKLEAAPWVDGEVMEVRLKRPAGGEYGTIIYSAQSNTLNDNDTWQIISHMYVTEGSISQYTFVEAAVESFIPVYGQTTNWMGNFVAEYNDGNVKLTIGPEGKESTRDLPVQTIAYDNEQALYLIRRMPLAENYEGSFPIFSVQGGSVIECRINVLATEEITVEAGTFTCYKTDLSIYSGGMRALQHTLWFSADEHKYLVKYDVGGTATMELAKVWQKDKGESLTFASEEPNFSVTIPDNWRFYNYDTASQSFLQLIASELKAWSVLIWQKRGTEPDSDSATTIAKADCEKLKGFFENYTPDETSWKEYKISGLEAARYLATYQEKGKQMVEYRSYILGDSLVYWFVFRIEKDKFEENRSEFDSIINSFSKTHSMSIGNR